MARKLTVGVEMSGIKHEEEIDLPDDWDSMSPKDRQSWADEALADHVSNHVDSWHDLDGLD